MSLNPRTLNRFLLFELPSAYLCGVRVNAISDSTCSVRVRHRWINQNPFNSMYFAVQAMAAELSTGALVMNQIKTSGAKISMLVASNKSSFSKKATGKIQFTCNDGALVSDAIQKTLESGDGQTFWMISVGLNENGVIVSEFDFEWTIKARSVR